MSDPHYKLLNWNVRGLNQPCRRQVLRDLVIADNGCSIACIQETKLQRVDDSVIAETLGSKFTGQYAFMPTQGTREGIVVACSQDYYTNSDVEIRQFPVSVSITRRIDNEKWMLTVVYGQQGEPDKHLFMDELRALNQVAQDRWPLLGDFNLIYRTMDKNNCNINRRTMSQFRTLLNGIEMKDVHLHGRRYTWSSGTQSPTQTKIDHLFASKEWELLHPGCHLQAGKLPCQTTVP
jgi:exonuclease III